TISVMVNGDLLNEPDETFGVLLINPTNATFANGNTSLVGTGTILNDDPVPAVTISNDALTEGAGGTTSLDFTLSLSAACVQVVTLLYDPHFTRRPQQSFPTRRSSDLTISVMVNGDLLNEPDETFGVLLINPTNATFATGDTFMVGTGTILNDDAAPI